MSAFDPAARQSRRAVIAGALGAALASVAGAFGKPARTDANTGDAMYSGVSTMTASHDTALATTAGSGFIATTSDTTTGAAGLYGIASATDAAVFGVIGETPSDAGVAISARSSATQGQTYGLAAGVHSNEGRAVQASAYSMTGPNSLAIYAENYAADGAVVFALAHGSQGARAVVGQVGSGGTAILGYAGSSALPAVSTDTAVYGFTDAGPGAIGVYGQASSGTAVFGSSTDGVGVSASSGTANGLESISSSGYAIFAQSGLGKASIVGFTASGNAAIVGHSAAGGSVATPPTKVGVYGRSTIDSSAKGVYGYSTTGVGVYGSATTGKAMSASASGPAGIAVNAAAADPSGFALKTSGRISFGRVSGVATLAANATSAVVTPGIDITSSSFVLLTPKGDPGTRRLWYTVDSTANTLTIHASASAATSLAVAWLLVG